MRLLRKDDPGQAPTDSVGKDRTTMVYHFMGYDLTITFTHLDHAKLEVVVGLGSETRTFQLEGFINFWLDLVNEGRKTADAHLDLTGRADSVRQG